MSEWNENNDIGMLAYNLASELFPICRSITGDGVRKTLSILNDVSLISVFEVPSGTKAFDWTVPREWNIKAAWVKDENGNVIIDFKKSNLHVLNYSIPVDMEVSGEELLEHLYSLPENPEWIPYVTSYYQDRWGFCVTDLQKKEIESYGVQKKYSVFIDSSLSDGHMTYGEIVIPGASEKEVLLSTYICHPSMANNELSGPCVAIYLAKWLRSLSNLKYTYRIIFIPETIGSILYLSKHLDCMKKNTIAGFVLTCIGDGGSFSYIPSRYGNTLSDKVAQNVLGHRCPDYLRYSFLDRGSDERQYCAPGVDLPVCSITKTKYGHYPQYHTSADDMSFISPKGLSDSFSMYQECIEVIENNEFYKINCLCEPQLGKRGLYPTISTKKSGEQVRDMMNFITYLDGTLDLIDISNKIGVPVVDLVEFVENMTKANLLDKVTYI